MPKLFTVKDLAALFQKDEETVRRWILDRIFPSAFKIKEGWYVPASDIKKMMKQNNASSDEATSTRTRATRPSTGFVSRWK